MDVIKSKSGEERVAMEDTEVKNEMTEDSDNSFKCPQCELVFECLLALDNHIRFHTNEHPYECLTCHQSFRTDAELYSHKQSFKNCSRKVKGDTSENLMCHICEKVLSTPYALMRHQRIHTGERPFRCIECNETFIDAGQLSKHMNTHNGRSQLQCKICSKVCVSQKRLEDHMFLHNGKKRYQCPVCNKMCRCKSHLDDHLRIHSGEKPFQCVLCHVSYRYKSQLREHHMIKHPTTEDCDDDVPPGKAKCQICDAIVTKTSMRSHKLLHNGKKYDCDRCPKSFVTKYRLTVHQRGHSGDKPFKCHVDGCGKEMSTKDGFLRHMVIHEGKKDFKCSECDREFFFRSNLNQHLKTHDKVAERFPCERCGKCFSRRSVLKTHQLTPCLGVIVVDQSISEANATIVAPVPSCAKAAQDTNYELQAVPSDARPNVIPDNDFIPLQEQSSVILFDTRGLNIPISTNEANFAEDEAIVIHNVLSPVRETVPSSCQSSEHSYHDQSLNKLTERVEVKTEIHEEDQTTGDYQNGGMSLDAEFPNEESLKEVSTQTQTLSEKRHTTTIFNKSADKIIEVEHPNDIVFTEDDISNLMTLAGVSTETQDSEFSLKFVCTNTDNESEAELISAKDPRTSDRNSHVVSEPEQIRPFSQEQIPISAPVQIPISVPEQIPISSQGHASTSVVEQSSYAPKETHILLNECASPEEKSEQRPSSTGTGNVDSHTAHCVEDSDTEMMQNEKSPNSTLGQDVTSDPITPGERKWTVNSGDSAELRSNEEQGFNCGTYTHECLHCDSNFRFQYALEEHCEQNHPGMDVYKCIDCTETFDSTRSLMRHSRVHSGNSKVQCQVCHRMFCNPQKLNNHMGKHFGERLKRFRCDICGRLFPDSTHFRDHMMVHSGVKPYECSECHHKFIRKREWETHMRIHTGELPFKCTKCDKSFRAATYLRNHMLNHSESKPFQCPECDKGYVRRSKLRLHMMNHTGTKPFQCEEPGCGKSYCERREFIHHSMTHRGEKPYECRFCHKAFTMKGNMIQHERIHNRP